MNRSFRQSGFTLMESIIGLGLLIGLGVVGLKLSQSMKQSSSGIRKISAMSKVMIQMRTMTTNAEVCTKNFKGKGAGDTISVIMDKENKAMMEMGSKIENDTIMVKEMKIEKIMPERKRAQVSVLFERLEKEGRAAHSKKVMNIMANIQAGKILECLDFGGAVDDSLVTKLCWDADPENFDAPPNDNFDCADNVAHLVAEVKSFYCKENGLIGDPVTGVCHPLDANLNCPDGSFLRGFLSDGTPNCYAPEPPDPIESNPTPLCWEGPTPGAFCTAAGVCGSDGANLPSECEVSGTWTATTLTCRPSSGNCAIFKSKTPAPSLCWQLPDPNKECLISGNCSTNGARQMTKCKDAMGNFQAGYNLLCAEVDPLFCVRGGSCNPNAWDGNQQPGDICTGNKVTETNECGEKREIDGTKDCAPKFKRDFALECGCTPFRQQSVTWRLDIPAGVDCKITSFDIIGSPQGPVTNGFTFTINNTSGSRASIECSAPISTIITKETMCPSFGSTNCEM